MRIGRANRPSVYVRAKASWRISGTPTCTVVVARRVFRGVAVVGWLVGALIPATAHATTYTVQPSADATVSSSKPSLNDGRSSTLTAIAGSTTNRIYLRFAVPALDGPVSAASLQLYPTTAADLSVRPQPNTSWSETAITWANAPPYGAPSDHSGSVGRGSYVRLDVTPHVAGSRAAGFTLTTAVTWTMKLASRETSTPPKLVITTRTATPPSSGAVPTVSGTATSGQTLHATSATWSGSAPMSYAYRWRRCDNSGGNCADVFGATSPTYTLTSADVGSRIRARVEATNLAGSSSADSAATAVVTAAAGAGRTYYVSTSGSDANPGTQAAPWRRVGYAADIARAASTVIIMGGSYAEDVKLSVSGAVGSPITFRGGASGPVAIRSLNVAASHVVASGLGVLGATGDCVSIQPALTDITLQDSKINNCGRDGVHFVRPTWQPYTSAVTIKNNDISAVGRSDSLANDLTIYANHITVQGNDLTGTPNDAINMWGDRHTYSQNTIHDLSNSYGHYDDAFQTWTGLDDGAEGRPVTNLVIDRNVIRDVLGNNAHAIMAQGPGHHDWTIRDNLVWGVGDQAFIFGEDGSATEGIRNILAYNNTFVRAGANNTIEFNLTSSGKLVNNVFYDCAGWGGGVPYVRASTATLTSDHNLAGGSTTRLSESHAKNGDPRFVNSSGDFRLQSTSPAIDTGDNGTIIDVQRPLDLDGNPNKGVGDIGAQEYQG